MPERDTNPQVTRIEPENRKDRKKQYAKLFFERSWERDECDTCRSAAASRDAVRAVLAAFPRRLLNACGGGVSAHVHAALRDQLEYTSIAVLTARIDRRWWQTWSTRPLTQEQKENREGYRPDDVALHLIEPTPCPGRCEDGWNVASEQHPDADDKPCRNCRGGRLLPGRITTADSDDDTTSASLSADRTLNESIAYRPMLECNGADGACGRPVQAPHQQCPTCLGWPMCRCGRRRYDPDHATACLRCTSQTPANSQPEPGRWRQG